MLNFAQRRQLENRLKSGGDSDHYRKILGDKAYNKIKNKYTVSVKSDSHDSDSFIKSYNQRNSFNRTNASTSSPKVTVQKTDTQYEKLKEKLEEIRREYGKKEEVKQEEQKPIVSRETSSGLPAGIDKYVSIGVGIMVLNTVLSFIRK